MSPRIYSLHNDKQQKDTGKAATREFMAFFLKKWLKLLIDYQNSFAINKPKLFNFKVVVRRKAAQSYHNLASWPLTVDCHSHPLVLFALSGYILYTETGTEIDTERILWLKYWGNKMSKTAKNILEKCTGVSVFLTGIIKDHSRARSWDGAHVTAVQSSRHFRPLTAQGFSFRGTNQQPATDTQMNPLRRVLDQMHIVKEAQAVTLGLRMRRILTFLPLAHYIITHSSLLCRTAAIVTHTSTHTSAPPNWCSMSSRSNWVKDPLSNPCCGWLN